MHLRVYDTLRFLVHGPRTATEILPRRLCLPQRQTETSRQAVDPAAATRPATGSPGTESGPRHRCSRRSRSPSPRRGPRRFPEIAHLGTSGDTRTDRSHLGPLRAKKNSTLPLRALEALRAARASLDQHYRENSFQALPLPPFLVLSTPVHLICRRISAIFSAIWLITFSMAVTFSSITC